jgi:hypothetical protein
MTTTSSASPTTCTRRALTALSVDAIIRMSLLDSRIWSLVEWRRTESYETATTPRTSVGTAASFDLRAGGLRPEGVDSLPRDAVQQEPTFDWAGAWLALTKRTGAANGVPRILGPIEPARSLPAGSIGSRHGQGRRRP